MSKRFYYFYICDDCKEVIPQRLDTIKNMKWVLCRNCSNKKRSRDNRDKIREATFNQMENGNWRLFSLTEEEKLKGKKKFSEILKKKYASGELEIWNKGKNIQTNTGKTHFKKGQKPWNYRGGISFIYGEDWSKIRRKIYKRDKYICQNCGKSHIKVHCHHIIPFYISKDNSEDNLITLCCSCHTKMDGMYRNVCNRSKYFSIINTWRLNNIW